MERKDLEEEDPTSADSPSSGLRRPLLLRQAEMTSEGGPCIFLEELRLVFLFPSCKRTAMESMRFELPNFMIDVVACA